MNRPVLIAPSLLASDFARLGSVLEGLDGAGTDWVHLDVMDGRFVPNLTFGPPVIAALRPHSRAFFDAHLMIENADRSLAAFAEAGCDAITVHAEATHHLHRTLTAIRQLGKKAGVAFNPATPIDCLRYVLDCVDLVLVMSVNPGFGGQKFIPAVLPKLASIRQLIDESGYPIQLSVDGGIDLATAPMVTAAGANVLVAGSAIFKGATDADWASRIGGLREAAALRA